MQPVPLASDWLGHGHAVVSKKGTEGFARNTSLTNKGRCREEILLCVDVCGHLDAVAGTTAVTLQSRWDMAVTCGYGRAETAYM